MASDKLDRKKFFVFIIFLILIVATLTVAIVIHNHNSNSISKSLINQGDLLSGETERNITRDYNEFLSKTSIFDNYRVTQTGSEYYYDLEVTKEKGNLIIKVRTPDIKDYDIVEDSKASLITLTEKGEVYLDRLDNLGLVYDEVNVSKIEIILKEELQAKDIRDEVIATSILKSDAGVYYYEYNIKESEYIKIGDNSILIIKIKDASHLDEDRDFVADVYNYVKAKEDSLTYVIPENNYLRTYFESGLCVGRDISIYANSSNGGRVEVYEKDSNVKIADFGIISGYGLYKIIVNNLTNEEQTTFDLKVVSGSVEFDYILDPACGSILDVDCRVNDWEACDAVIGCIGIPEENGTCMVSGTELENNADDLCFPSTDNKFPSGGARATECADKYWCEVTGYEEVCLLCGVTGEHMGCWDYNGGTEVSTEGEAECISWGLNWTSISNCATTGNACTESEGGDTTPPTIAIQPYTGTYTTTAYPVNFTLNESGTCALSLNGGQSNTSMSNSSTTLWTNASVTFAQGANTLTAYCSDSAGNPATNATTITVDSLGPNINITNPLNISYSTTTIAFNFTLTEAGNCSYGLDGVNNSMTNSSTTNWYASNTTMGVGAHLLLAFCNDSLGNKNMSSINFSIDSAVPALNFTLPTLDNGTTITTNYQMINATSNENVSKCFLSLNQPSYILSGSTTPSDADGNYSDSGEYQGKRYFKHSSNDYYLWWSPALFEWTLSQGEVGNTTSFFARTSPRITGVYYNVGGAGNVLIVTGGSNRFTTNWTMNNSNNGASTSAYHNLTNLEPETDYIYWVSCNDTSGNMNRTENRSLLTGYVSPYFNDILKNQSYAIAGNYINYSAMVSDDVRVSNAWLSHNFDMTWKENVTQLIGSTASTYGNGTWRGQTFSFNGSGYIYEVCFNMSKSVTKNKTTSLVLSQLSGYVPTTQLANITFNTSIIGITSRSLKCFNFTQPPYLTGNVSYALYFKTANSTTATEYATRYSSASPYPLGRYIYTTNRGISWTSSSSIDLMFVIKRGNYDTKNDTALVIDSANQNISTIKQMNFAKTTPFSYRWCANDSSNHLNCSDSYSISVYPASITDTQSPTGSIISPPNLTKINGNLTLDGTASDDTGIDYASFYIQNSTLAWTNVTGCSFIYSPYDCVLDTSLYTNSTEGYDIKIVPCDLVGNCNSSTQIKHYTIDKSVPILNAKQIVYPIGQSTAKDSQTIYLRVNATDSGGAGINRTDVDLTNLNTTGNITMILQSGDRASGQLNTWNYSVFIDSTTGTQQSNFYIFDNATTNNVFNDLFLVDIDNDNPQYSNYNNTGIQPIYNGTEVTTYLTATDNLNLSYFIYQNNCTKGDTGLVNSSNITLINALSDTASFNLPISQNCSYRYLLFDDAGNLNVTEFGTINILGNAPTDLVVSLISPEDLNSTSSSWNLYQYNYTGGSAQSCNLLIDEAEVNSTTTPAENTTLNLGYNLSIGIYEWFVRCNRTDGFNFDSERRNINISEATGDTTAPIVDRLYQIPADLDTLNSLVNGINITYNITDETAINISTIYLYYKVNSSTDNIMYYQNGTSHEGYFKIAYLYNATPYNFTWWLEDNYYLPGTYNYGQISMERELHTAVNLGSANVAVKVELLNVSNTSAYGWYEIMLNKSSSSGAGSNTYYCNETYTTGSVVTNANCVLFYTLPATTTYNHTHLGDKSRHQAMPFVVNTTTGKVGNKVIVTSKSYFVTTGSSGGTWRFYQIANTSRTDAIQTTATIGGSWTSQTYTVDAHLHQFNPSTTLRYYACANDTSNNRNCSDESLDLMEQGGLPPDVFVFTPISQLYSGSINITGYSESPNAYDIANTSIYLVNSSFDEILHLNFTTLNPFSYYWDSTNVSDGEYFIKAVVKDNLSQIGTGFSENFTIDNTAPTFLYIPASINLSFGSPLLVNFTASDDIALGTFAINYTDTFEINTTGTLINSTALIGGGSYYINVTINDTMGNTNSTIWNVNFTPIGNTILYSLIPSANESNGTATGAGCSADGTILNFTMNGTQVANPYNATLDIGVYTFNCSAGDNNYTINSTTFVLNIYNGSAPCIPDIQNTTPTDWANESCVLTEMNQSRSYVEFDANVCGFVNVTHYEYQFVGPTYTNTSAGDWMSEGCVINDLNQSRNWTGYDNYFCADNITYFEYNLSVADLQYTDWTSWSNDTCVGDNMNQSRTRVQYDANNYGCFANLTSYEYDIGYPIKENTSWSDWTNDTCIGIQMNQTSFLTQYDISGFGCYANETFYREQLVGPTHLNTSFGDWMDESCIINDLNQSRNATQYDIYFCDANTTVFDYQLLTANLTYTSWTSWSNETCVGNNMNQSRSKTQYDSENLGCFVNDTTFEYQLVGPTYTNTTPTDWVNETCIVATNKMNQSRYWVQYDNYACASNTTFWEYRQTVNCNSLLQIDFVAPTILSGTYNDTSIWVNVSVSGNNSNVDTTTIWLYNLTDLVNSSAISNTNLFVNFTSLPYTTYYFNASVNDSGGGFNWTTQRTVVLNVSYFNTSTFVLTILSPENGQYYFPGSMLINATADRIINTMWYNLNYTTNITFTEAGVNFYFPTGTYNLTIWANDSWGVETMASILFYVNTQEESTFYVIFLILVIFITLFLIGFKTQDWYFIMFAGFILLPLAIYLFRYGFPTFSNDFAMNVIASVVGGVGLYLIGLSSINLIQENAG